MTGLRTNEGANLAYRRGGAGPPLILVHGTASDSSQWEPVRPILESHFTVYAVDRRGYGLSGDGPGYRIESEFDDLAALATMIGGPVDVVAHSYGALCVLGAAYSAPFRRVVVYEPSLPIRPGAYFAPQLIATMREALARGDEAAAVAAFAAEVLGMEPRQIDAAQRLDSWRGLAGHAARILRELENVERFSGHPEFFARCHVPTLLLLGGESAAQYRATAEALNAVLPASRIVVLPEQRHGAIAAAPALFGREVIAFLAAGDPLRQEN